MPGLRSTSATLPGLSAAFVTLMLWLSPAVDEATTPSSVYDFVVVGAGSSGSIVAGRLAVAGYSVKLLEAGGRTQASLGGCSTPTQRERTWCPYVPDELRTNGSLLSIFDVPLGWLEIISRRDLVEDFEWDLTGALPNTSVPKVARAVGGCGIHNAMIYMRGTEKDFAPGSSWDFPGWDYESVLSYYKKSENNSDFRDSAFHSTLGPVQIGKIRDVDRASASLLFQRAAVETGKTVYNGDFNGAGRLGVGPYQFLIRNGVRDSTAAAFLEAGDAGTDTERYTER